MESLPDYNKISFPPSEGIPLTKLVPDASDQARRLLGKFLVYSSCNRIEADDVSAFLLSKSLTTTCLPRALVAHLFLWLNRRLSWTLISFRIRYLLITLNFRFPRRGLHLPPQL
jgi:hypothetical protein